jgi:hypothetical protein
MFAGYVKVLIAWSAECEYGTRAQVVNFRFDGGNQWTLELGTDICNKHRYMQQTRTVNADMDFNPLKTKRICFI